MKVELFFSCVASLDCGVLQIDSSEGVLEHVCVDRDRKAESRLSSEDYLSGNRTTPSLSRISNVSSSFVARIEVVLIVFCTKVVDAGIQYFHYVLLEQ